jgi:hypothetical protein
MEKLANIKYTKKSTMECHKPLLKEYVTPNELEWIESNLKLIAQNTISDVKNSLNDVINGIDNLNI